MKISYNWLQEYVSGKLPPPAKLAELLTMHSFEVESVEKVGKDSVLDVAVLPNRAHDCLSHVGIAKELSALLKSNVQSPKSKVKENSKIKTSDFINIEIKNKARCPFYAARVVLNVKVGPSPKWLRERLEALGQKSINNVVDAANYAMLETGQPLHAFDFEKIESAEKRKTKNEKRKIIIRDAKRGEKIKILGGGEYELADHDLMIADDVGVLAIAGVKGGVKAEVTAETKSIVLESAYFEPSSVRATSKRLGLRTDASWRFENGVVPALVEKALDRVAGLIADLAEGEIAGGVARAGKITIAQGRIFFTARDINKLLGVEIGEKEILAILKRLGFEIGKAKGGYVAVAPTERLDASRLQDLAEEVGRVYGFENIPSVLPESVLVPSPRNDELVISDKIKTMLSGIGFFETYNRSFVGEKQLDLFSFDKLRAVAMANPMSLDHKYLRPSLVLHLLNNTAENLKHQKRINIFEIGNVFSLEKSEVSERTMLAGITAEKGQGADATNGGFYELKGVMDALLESIGLDDFHYDEYTELSNTDRQLWRADRTALIKVGDKTIGVMGEIDGRILRGLGIVERVTAFEISTRDLIDLAEEKMAYTPISKFPTVERDIAVLVPASVKVDEVQQVIETAGGELLSDSDLFDTYNPRTERTEPRLGKRPRWTAVCDQSQSSWTNREQSSYDDEHLEAERKSLAFHLTFQSPDRTLTDSEVNGIFNRIVKAVEERGWEVRS